MYGSGTLFQQPGLTGGAGAGGFNGRDRHTPSPASMDNNNSDSNDIQLHKNHKHGLIVGYLKKIVGPGFVTFGDIHRDLKIDLLHDQDVLELLLRNDEVVCEAIAATPNNNSLPPTGTASYKLRYARKHVMSNKKELFLRISRVKDGLSFNEIMHCYKNIAEDVKSALVGGDIIAVRNRENKDMVLFPRGKKFLCKLSGTVTAVQDETAIATSESLLQEIRRGEAICIDGKDGRDWYRVSCATKPITAAVAISATKDAIASSQAVPAPTPALAPAAAAAGTTAAAGTAGAGAGGGTGTAASAASAAGGAVDKLSVSLDKDLPLNLAKHFYCEPYTDTRLPLDGAYEGSSASSSSSGNDGDSSAGVVCQALRHGCTTDIKERWNRTAELIGPFYQAGTTFQNNEGCRLLEAKCVQLGLIPQSSGMYQQIVGGTQNIRSTIVTEEDGALGGPQRKKPRKHTIKNVSKAVTSVASTSQHLEGTDYGRMLQEAAAAVVESRNQAALARSAGNGGAK